MLRALCRVLLPLAGLALAGCGSAGSYLRHDDGRLLDSEIRIETQRRLRRDDQPDVRMLRCRDGNIVASIHSPRRGLTGEAVVSFDDYAAVWRRWNDEAFTYDVEAVDPEGAYYHVASVSLGIRFNRFSAQDRRTFLGMATQDIVARLDLVNSFVEFLDDHVTLVAIPPAAEGEGEEKRR